MLQVILAVVGVLMAILFVGWLFHRVCIRLEDAGYLYYRKPNERGSAGAATAFTMDQFVRPSTQHIIEVEEKAKIDHESIGGE